jgi:hypothetical protein
MWQHNVLAAAAAACLLAHCSAQCYNTFRAGAVRSPFGSICLQPSYSYLDYLAAWMDGWTPWPLPPDWSTAGSPWIRCRPERRGGREARGVSELNSLFELRRALLHAGRVGSMPNQFTDAIGWWCSIYLLIC